MPSKECGLDRERRSAKEERKRERGDFSREINIGGTRYSEGKLVLGTGRVRVRGHVAVIGGCWSGSCMGIHNRVGPADLMEYHWMDKSICPGPDRPQVWF